jgi:hypothetical protein
MRPAEYPLRWAAALAVVVLLWAGPAPGQKTAPQEPRPESIADWPYFKTVVPIGEGDEAQSPWVDFVLDRDVFTSAKYDLGDLRLFDAAGNPLSYALRTRVPEFRTVPASATEFNRADGPDDSSELSLDLGAEPIEHNEVEVGLPGENFRRRAVLEGSDDRNAWRQLAEDYLIRFRVDRPPSEEGEEEPGRIEDVALSYPPSRFRYLRLRVYPDPVADAGKPGRRVEIGEVVVQRRVALPGEMLTLAAELGPREPTRDQRLGVAASAWIVDLGGENVPVSRIEVEIADASFVREYRIESAGPPEEYRPWDPFRLVHSGTWQRREGEEPEPMVGEFHEVRAARLRLTVVDHGNAPLDVRGVKFTAAARQIVFPKPESWEEEIRLYYGNPDGLAPNYDFARNLPARLEPEPSRTAFGPQQDNPDYVPEPPPLTERWPWLVYTVLGGASLLLGVLLVSVGRAAVGQHDRKSQEATEQRPEEESDAPAG